MDYLTDKLKEYTASGMLPMHMPGHKRNTGKFPWLRDLGADLDITEIEGFDNLNDPQGLFREMNGLAASLWGAGESFCLVNGSTGGLLAAVKLGLGRGGGLLMCRNAHKSLYNAAELMAAEVSYIVPPTVGAYGMFGSVAPESVGEALRKNGNIRLVAVTSPTYEGIISDIAAIARVCHEHGALLLVDEAHGAHLGFGGFPAGAVRCGADFVVQSLHKTLPSLTQTAVLHVRSGCVSRAEAQRAVSVFQSSSPSYLLSASIDGCLRYMRDYGESSAALWLKTIETTRAGLKGLKALKLLLKMPDDGIFKLDPSKIVISTRRADITGAELARRLRCDYGIEAEMAAADYIVLMTGMGDTEKSAARLADALKDIDEGLEPEAFRAGESAGFTLPPRAMSAKNALTMPKAACPLDASEGRVSAEYVWTYPPGIPVTVPGERITREAILRIKNDTGAGLDVRSSENALPGAIYCICE